MQLPKILILIVGLLGAVHSYAAVQNTLNITPIESITTQEATSKLDQRFKHAQQREKPVVALVLGSGGARGYAHIGVIQVLEKKGIHPDFIVGTSAGSIVGSLYASGMSASKLRNVALDMKVADVREFKIGLKGFFDGGKVEDYVNQQVKQQPLDKLKIPMYVVAIKLNNGKKPICEYGNRRQGLRASLYISRMFVPTVIGGEEYVDGGLVSPVPVNIARDLGADIIIAVNILAQPAYTETSNIWGLFNQNINIMQNRLAEEEMKNADIVIQPDLREKAHIFDVKGRQDTIQAGIDATQQRLPVIEAVMMQKKNQLSGQRVNVD